MKPKMEQAQMLPRWLKAEIKTMQLQMQTREAKLRIALTTTSALQGMRLAINDSVRSDQLIRDELCACLLGLSVRLSSS